MSFRSRRRWGLWLVALVWGLVVACQPSSPTASPNASPAPSIDCRTVEHLLGQTCIPAAPQRIVVLHDSTLLDPLLALGLEPIAVAAYPNDDGSPLLRGIPSDVAQELTLVGTPDQPNLEAILNLKPDLIMGREFQRGFYGPLSAIAPTVMVNWQDGGFKGHLQTVSTLLGQPEAAQTVLDRYQQRIQQLQQALGDRLNTLTVSVIAVQGPEIKTFGLLSTLGEVLQDAGLQRPAAQTQPKGRIDLSLEQLTAHDGDAMFLVHESGEEIIRYQQSALWQQLRAVQTERIYAVEPENWIVAGPLGANRILDDLFTYLVENS
ncbi:ABC transporter substrate-binding protein [Nodosilinea sp. LEGE 06152]|uniref:ABC transporter substrate-binding protein n=1 Tax=Nodosilinea sp. LEGE 06152 TaxID=2777966 RepID=UPI0018828C44|nr:ABC transporter substrate-binding protein [Nodosilinea sp. LEGE 06152]MBE9157000.1 ABC transporter substrate-binding protein [Nodosilinea sp. LEGE 06152]